jgi:uncharacterized protein DUF4244
MKPHTDEHKNIRRSMFLQPRPLFLDDRGMVTTEYAMGMILATTFVVVLYLIIQGEPVEKGLTTLVEEALDFRGR